MYSLNGQGLPLIIPIDPSNAVRAILTDRKLSEPLYNSLGIDIKNLKKRITAEVTRGIAEGMSNYDIARNLHNATKAPLARARTIARTESRRIQEAASFDAGKVAKSKGADIVKQWDASLDGDTRDTHRELDGKIVELEEYFASGTNKALYPGKFGDPAEDCNCRCSALKRARSALDADELKVLKERAEFFGLDKTKDFEDFKKKYLKAAKSVENSDNYGIISTETDSIIEFKAAANIDDAKEYAIDTLGLDQVEAYSVGINVDVANGVNEAIFNISNTLGSLTEYGYLNDVRLGAIGSDSYASYAVSSRTMFLNPVAKQRDALEQMAKTATRQFDLGAWSTGHALHTVYHELGHGVQHMLLDNDTIMRKKIDDLYRKTISELFGSNFEWGPELATAAADAAKIKNEGFSYYGLYNSGEFVAEAVAQYFCSQAPSAITMQIIRILTGG